MAYLHENELYALSSMVERLGEVVANGFFFISFFFLIHLRGNGTMINIR